MTSILGLSFAAIGSDVWITVAFVLAILCLLVSMFYLIFPDNSQEFIYFQF